MNKFLFLIFVIIASTSLVGCEKPEIQPEKYDIKWLDTDGSSLGTTVVEHGNYPSFDLPLDSDKWDYIGWTPSISSASRNYTYTAKRNIKEDYFVGNVFQIIVYDLGNSPIATGSGFVYNAEGWFLTNDHVMNEGYFAQAIFNIKDDITGESFTKLDINYAAYRHEDKDIFIGQINNYDKIGNEYYKEFDFAEDYDYGDTTYSIGYPNSSINLHVNKGEVQSDLSSLYNKIYSGISYIGSTSFIAPGSSGGILVNDNLEVLGITTLGISDSTGDFLLGASIETFNFINLLDDFNANDLEIFGIFMHPEEYVFIGYFLEAKEHYESQEYDVRKEEYQGFVRYTYYWEEEGENIDGWDYLYEATFSIDSDMWMEYIEEYYWDTGDRRIQKFYGYYSIKDELDNFIYEFKYTWDSGTYYSVYSDDINYSTNLSLTLNNIDTSSPYNYTILDSDLEYAREQFNYMYEWLYTDIEQFK